ncbi:MAG TPA: bifunctional aspartate kinase/homoserine dehydrogenase I [bacterium]|nr:bifunctional aspartate kinase/homoserine dehydrogenase I [bacterium]
MKILKLGGSTLRSTEDFQRILTLVRDTRVQQPDIAVVVSAVADATDALIEISRQASMRNNAYLGLLEGFTDRHRTLADTFCSDEKGTACRESVETLLTNLTDILHGVYLVQELSDKTRDFIMSFGERLAASLLCGALENAGIPAEYADARIFIKTDNRFGVARVYLDESLALIKSHFESRTRIQIIPGFIGSTRAKETTTLGRGASDLTAALVGAALGAEGIEIWTDVDGVMTADPRKVGKAIPIDALSYDEAMELSHFGAHLLRPQAIQPACKYRIPIVIRNARNPEFRGTVIGERTPSPYLIKGISSIDAVALLRVQGGGMAGVAGVSGRLFTALAKEGINIILISQASSEHTICLALRPESADQARTAIESEFRPELVSGQIDGVIIENDLSVIAVVGENMRRTPGIAARMFDALGKNGINVSAIAQGSSELNISTVISRADESKALNALHDIFFLSGTKTIHLFQLGTGLIGGTLLEQVRDHETAIRESSGMDLRFIGIGNVDGWHMEPAGIPTDRWREILGQKARPMDLDAFIRRMVEINLPNSIFVDCTGSADVVDHYETLFGASISVVTPNKIANSGPLTRYRRLKETAARHKARFLYETNVGAGLPVISTLNDLIASGDRVLKIEAILSGTLSFIFNTYTPDAAFSDVVKEAQKRGLSEPDPRDDLNGLDVARKLLILARECGEEMEPEDIVVENILPGPCREAASVEDFFTVLKAHDALFARKRDEALNRGRVLRYMACLEKGRATVSLQEVGQEHPFHALSGSDNMIVISTERYHERPLVVKGPGAGAQVTAAGIFADILRIANYLSR